MKESIFNIKVKVNSDEYIYNSKNNGIIQLDNEGLNKKENIKYLLDEGYYVEDDCDEISSLIKEVNENIKNEKEDLLLTIALTEKCNFRCVYCYQEHDPKFLSMDDAQKLITEVKGILDKIKYNVIRIHYFGGEPLLNLDMLYFLDDEFKKISKQYNIEYRPYLTTNGSKLNKTILSRVRFRNVQLTIDGLEDTHNNLRRSSYFKFQDEINLIPDILELSDRLTIRFNICEENKNDLIPLIDFLMNTFHSKKLHFITARTIKFSKEDKITMVSFEEYTKLSLMARMKLGEYGVEFTLPQSAKYPCPFANRNAFSITSDLILKPCYESSNLLQENFSSAAINIKNEYKISQECTKCNILPLCLGGCNKARELGYESCIPEKNNIRDIITSYIKQKC